MPRYFPSSHDGQWIAPVGLRAVAAENPTVGQFCRRIAD